MIIPLFLGIVGVNIVLLLLLQPSTMLFTEDSPEMSFRSIVIGSCLSVIVFFVIIHPLFFPPLANNSDEPLWLFAQKYLGISIPISCLLNVGLKGLYEALVLPRLRKMRDKAHLQTKIIWLKTSIVICFFLAIGTHQLLIRIHQATVRRTMEGRAYLERLLGEPLPPSVTQIRAKQVHTYTSNTSWLKFICTDEKVIEKLRIRKGLISNGKGCDVYVYEYDIPDWWWKYGTDTRMESYIEEEDRDRETDVIFCYDPQNHIAYYHAIWRDFGAGSI